MKREKGLDFVRAISVIGIVAFHFYVHSNSEHKLFLVHANGAWGGTLNYLFFILSGIVLHLHYDTGETINLRQFYYKRWKAVMPAYLFSYTCTFLLQMVKTRQFFHRAVPIYRLLLTLVGMDGYFNMFFPTFFLVGEWFLSVIILLYMVYPLLNYLMKKNNCLTLLGLLALYILIFYVDFFGVPTTVNIIPCLLCMYIGMMIARSPQLLKSRAAALISAVCCTVYILFPIGEVYLSEEILVGATLLLSLNYVGGHLCRIPCVDRFITMVSRYGFYIFLVQHRLIVKVLARYNPSNTVIALLLLLGCTVALLVFSHFFEKLLKRILGSKLFLKFENTITGANL